ncbi:uncharacterized protein LOC134241375 isoform X2 [Saccostrea cucullata]
MPSHCKECPECGSTFTKRSFSRHVQKYFDNVNNLWIPHRVSDTSSRTIFSSPVSTPSSCLYSISDDDSDSNDAFEPSGNVFDMSGIHNLEAGTDDDDLPPAESQNYQLYAEESDESSEDEIFHVSDGEEGQDDGDESREEDSDNGDSGSDSEDSDPEVWEEVSPESIDSEMGVDKDATKTNITDFLTFFVGMLIYWQTVHHVSDNGMDYLFQNIFTFFQTIGVQIDNSYFRNLCMAFPPSLYMAHKFLNLDKDNFKRYVVCPSCLKLYDLHECVEERNGVRVAKLCSNEVRVRGRQTAPCRAHLMKEIVCKGNVRKFYPLKVYCYNSIIEGLEGVMKRQEIKEVWEHWKDWDDNEGVLRDVYDGRVWNKFKTFENKSFLSDTRGIGLMMNIDWFQPFKNRNDYSVGVIYFAILNLPRSIRYKSENIIIAGLIPAFQKEPKLNSFLEPIVKELNCLWKGVKLESSLSRIHMTFRAALLCVACDIPAARKCCGFKSHAATLGCHKCFKTFGGGFGEKRDYSGFDRQNWKPRAKASHNLYAKRVKNAKTKTEADNLAKKYGTYYSVLIELEYFDAITFCVIDPMHNLFLGTAKTVFKLWVEREILSPKQLEKVESRLEDVNSATDIGRIPNHISGNYGVFSAAEWKNWTVSFSLYALCGILPQEDYRCWEKFVLACRILCKPFISVEDVSKVDSLLLNFCKSFERLYGLSSITCNMHLHCHLKECLLDYGPIHVFWCFSFERFNGAFGKLHTNNKSIEIQFMRKIMTSKFCETLKETLASSNLFELLGGFFEMDKAKSLVNNAMGDIVKVLKMACAESVNFLDLVSKSYVSLPKVYKFAMLNDEDRVLLLASYRKMYPSLIFDVCNLGEVIKKYNFVTIFGEKFGSKSDCRKLRSANVMASKLFDDDFCEPDFDMRPCRVDFYFEHTLSVENRDVTNVFAKVTWYKEYSERFKYGNALEMWFSNKFENSSASCFIPVERIKCRFSRGITGYSKDLMCLCPLPRKIVNDN